MSPVSPRPLAIGVLCYPTFGGSGVVAVELAQALAQRGHAVHLLSYAPPARLDAFDERVHLHEVAVSSYPLFKYPPYDLALASRLAEVAEAVPLDLVHAHYAIPHTMAALTVKDVVHPRPLPVLTTLHGTDITIVGQDPSYARITRYALGRSDAITAVSEWLAATTVAMFGSERKIEVVPNFVDGRRFRPELDGTARRCFAPNGQMVLMHVSNFRPVKRAHRVIEVFARVAPRVSSTLVMVGDGPDRPACEELTRTLGLRSRVRFLGAQTDIERLLPAAHVFLLPSEYESFGLAALEAMACGVVPIATATGGLPEVVDHGQTGLLVPADDLESMVDATMELLDNRTRLATMSVAAREAAVGRFGRERIVDRYEAICRRLVDATGVAREGR